MPSLKDRKAGRDLGLHVECPFCGFICTHPNITTMTWCSGCFVEYELSRNGKVMFDKRLKTPRFLWAKAIQKSGGMRIGKV